MWVLGRSCQGKPVLPRSASRLRQSRCTKSGEMRQWAKSHPLERKTPAGLGKRILKYWDWKAIVGSRTEAEFTNGSQDWIHPWARKGLLWTPSKMICRWASTSMKGPKDGVNGHLGPQSPGSKSVQTGNQWNWDMQLNQPHHAFPSPEKGWLPYSLT